METKKTFREKLERNPWRYIISLCVATGMIVAGVIIWVYERDESYLIKKHQAEMIYSKNEYEFKIRNLESTIGSLKKRLKNCKEPNCKECLKNCKNLNVVTLSKIVVSYFPRQDMIDNGICYGGKLSWLPTGQWERDIVIYDYSVPEPPEDHPVWNYVKNLPAPDFRGKEDYQALYLKRFRCNDNINGSYIKADGRLIKLSYSDNNKKNWRSWGAVKLGLSLAEQHGSSEVLIHEFLDENEQVIFRFKTVPNSSLYQICLSKEKKIELGPCWKKFKETGSHTFRSVKGYTRTSYKSIIYLNQCH